MIYLHNYFGFCFSGNQLEVTYFRTVAISKETINSLIILYFIITYIFLCYDINIMKKIYNSAMNQSRKVKTISHQSSIHKAEQMEKDIQWKY